MEWHPSMTNLMEDDIVVGLELSMFTFNIRKQVCDVWNGFIWFLTKYKKKTHNMISLMLDPNFKNIKFISFFIGKKQMISMVEVYDRKYLFSMLLKCHHIFQPMVEFFKLWQINWMMMIFILAFFRWLMGLVNC